VPHLLSGQEILIKDIVVGNTGGLHLPKGAMIRILNSKWITSDDELMLPDIAKVRGRRERSGGGEGRGGEGRRERERERDGGREGGPNIAKVWDEGEACPLVGTGARENKKGVSG
jgi:hypothetical protein